MDCSYLKYLLHYGIVFFVLLMIGIMIMGIWASDTKNVGFQIAFIIWLAFGMIDAELFEPAFQPFMLLLARALCEMKPTCVRAVPQVLPHGGNITMAG